MLSGTPTAAGTAGFTVDVTDSAGATLTKTYALTVHPALTISPAALVAATAGAPTSQTITVSSGTPPYTTFSISGFSAGTTGLTAGDLTADAAAGTVVLTSTPTAGTASFTVDVTDSAGATLDQELHADRQSGTRDRPGGAGRGHGRDGRPARQLPFPTAPSPTLPSTISGFSAGTTGLTAGDLTRDAAAGTVVLTGTPRRRTASFTVDVTDTAGATLSKSYTSDRQSGSSDCARRRWPRPLRGRATNQTITVSDGSKPYSTFNVSGFSAGTTGTDGGGSDDRPGSGDGDAERHTDSRWHRDLHGGCYRYRRRPPSAKSYTLTVNPALSIAPTALADATAGTATSQTITVSDGSKPYSTFNVTGFSAGTTGLTAGDLTTDAAAGTVVLSGTPTAAGTASFTVDVIDSVGATLSQSYTLTVNPALAIAPAALAEATAGTATSQTITVSSGSKPYTTFSISGFSAAPPG